MWSPGRASRPGQPRSGSPPKKGRFVLPRLPKDRLPASVTGVVTPTRVPVAGREGSSVARSPTACRHLQATRLTSDKAVTPFLVLNAALVAAMTAVTPPREARKPPPRRPSGHPSPRDARRTRLRGATRRGPGAPPVGRASARPPELKSPRVPRLATRRNAAAVVTAKGAVVGVRTPPRAPATDGLHVEA